MMFLGLSRYSVWLCMLLISSCSCWEGFVSMDVVEVVVFMCK